MEGTKKSFDSVWLSIRHWLNWVGLRLKGVRDLQPRDIKIMEELNLPMPPPKKQRFMVVTWTKPNEEWLKLNIDVGSINNSGESGAG